jgi:hypothetical protein
MAQILAKARNAIHREMTAKWGFLVSLQISANDRKLKKTPSEGKGHTFESCRVRQGYQALPAFDLFGHAGWVSTG